jgi:hypothetical protein
LVILWTAAGLLAGTVLLSPFILSVHHRDRVIGGMICGGIPLEIAGLLYGLRRLRRGQSQ